MQPCLITTAAAAPAAAADADAFVVVLSVVSLYTPTVDQSEMLGRYDSGGDADEQPAGTPD